MLDNISIYILGYGTGIVTTMIGVFVKDWYANRSRVVEQQALVPAVRQNEIQDALFIHFRPPETSIANGLTCLVCMEEFLSKQALVECTSCHTILGHATCLETWFQRKLSCPHCRKDFFEEV